MKLTSLLSSWILLVAVEPSGAAHKRHQEHRGERTMIQETSTTEYGNRILMTNDKKGEMKKADDTEQGVQATPEQPNQVDQGVQATPEQPNQVDQGVQTNAEQQNQADHGGPANQEQPNQAVTDNNGVNDAATTTANDEQVVEGSVNDAGSNVEGGPTVGSPGLVNGAITATPSRPSHPKSKVCCECHTHKVPCLGELFVFDFCGDEELFPDWYCSSLAETSCDRMAFDAFQLPAYATSDFKEPEVAQDILFLPPQVATVSGFRTMIGVPLYGTHIKNSEGRIGFGSALSSLGGRSSQKALFSDFQRLKSSAKKGLLDSKKEVETQNNFGAVEYDFSNFNDASLNVRTESGVLFLRGSVPDFVWYLNYFFTDRPEGYDYRREYPDFLDGKGCSYLAVVGGTGSFRLATGSVRYCWNLDFDISVPFYLNFEGVCGCEESSCCTGSTPVTLWKP